MASTQELCERMEALVDATDTERAHADADDILIEALRTVAQKMNKVDSVNINALCDAFEAMDKWYA